MASRVLVCLCLSLLALLTSREALACAMCGNGALAPREDEIGRFRATLDFKAGSAESGQLRLEDRRLDLTLGFAPIRRLELELDLAGLERTVRGPQRNLAVDAVVPGDLELLAVGTIWEARGPASERLALHGGVKFPTAPVEHDASGAPLPSLLQPGCSSIVPDLGVAYSLIHGDWGFVTTASLLLPIAIRRAPHSAESIRSTAAFDLRPIKWLTLRAGIGLRLEPSGELETGKSDPNSGGFVGSITTELIFTPVRRFSFGAGLYSPVVQVLRGEEHVGETFDAHVDIAF